MDTTENEIQALREEINNLSNKSFALYEDLGKQNELLLEQIISLRRENVALAKELVEQIITLRQENFALCKELSKQHASLNDAIRFFGGDTTHDNLRKYLNRLAGMQTAEFIVKNMPKVKAFPNRKIYLEHILKQTSDDVGGGLYLEFGVFKGESINVISTFKPDKIIYGFDSFEGLPEDWRYDLRKGGFDVGGRLPQVNENVQLIKGWFNETLPVFVKEHPEPCAFIHVDCDIYSSTKTVLNALRNKIVSGTIIAFDEYFNYPSWQEGEYKAFMEFIVENNLEFKYIARTNSCQVAVKVE